MVPMAAHTAEVVRNLTCGSPSRAAPTAAGMGAARVAESMVAIAPRRATADRAERPTTAAPEPPAEAGVPSAEVVVDTPLAAEAEAAMPVAGGTLVEAIDKFETFGRVEVSRKLQ